MAAMWASVSKISVVLDTGGRQGEASPIIGVVVSVQPVDGSGEPVDVTESGLVESVSLIDYVDESPIPVKEDKPDWYCGKGEATVRPGRTPQVRYEVGWGGWRTRNPRSRQSGFGSNLIRPIPPHSRTPSTAR